MMANSPRKLWSVARGLLKEHFSFNEIKDVCGLVGLPVEQLSQLSQRQGSNARWNTKGELSDGLDRLFSDLSEDEADKVVLLLFQEMLERSGSDNQQLLDDTSKYVGRFGWTIRGLQLAPMELVMPIRMSEIPTEFENRIGKLLERYRNGDFNGAITTLAGMIDDLTEEIWKAYDNLNHLEHAQAGFDKKVTDAFGALRSGLEQALGDDHPDTKDIVTSVSGAIAQSAKALQRLRRSFSDAHGEKQAGDYLVKQTLAITLFLFTTLHELREQCRRSQKGQA
ncbi:MAG: hypothetical protein HQM00_07020 [Magnetococcales bacterium]|nr:hypothetical protein [Magnetococcales bacterium]